MCRFTIPFQGCAEQTEMVATPGPLIVSIYGLGTSVTLEVAAATLESLGFEVAGATACVSAWLAWMDKSDKRS